MSETQRNSRKALSESIFISRTNFAWIHPLVRGYVQTWVYQFTRQYSELEQKNKEEIKERRKTERRNKKQLKRIKKSEESKN